MKTVTIKSRHGHDIPCHETYRGEDKVLIVCHGFGSSKASPMVQALEDYMPRQGIGVFAFDFPAHGDSPVWDLRETLAFSGSRFSFDTIAGDWGLGVRVNLDFILVRVDMGAKVYEPCQPVGSRWIGPKDWLNRNNFALHFGVGYPF